MATELLATISKDEIERANYHTRLVLQRDNAHTRAVLLSEGREKGLKERSVEIAKKAIALDLPMEQIESLTGLSRAEIESLRQ
jgi:predicted transposase/invertase (TIGR01784 family)